MTERTCSIDGCTKPPKARGFCVAHYQRWKRSGDPGPAATRPRRSPGTFGECATEGCGRVARANGLCTSCSAKAWRARAGSCTIRGCKGRADARGLCGKHYQQVRNGTLSHPAAAEILRETPCSVDGCERAVYSRGLCNMHLNRQWRDGSPGEAAPRRTVYLPGQTCAREGCPRLAAHSGYCKTHMRRLRRFGITEAEVDALLAKQKNRCAICKSAKPYGSGDWHIDHDKVTGQVRGLLCSKCNPGLGMFDHDPKILAAALRYVIKHRQMQLFGPAGPIQA